MVRMISEYPAGELKFAGVGVSDRGSADDAAIDLAAALAAWSAAHPNDRIVQLSVLPATSSGGARGAGTSHSYAAMALITYVSSALDGGTAAEAVAAAVEEIHVAQVNAVEEPRNATPPR